MFLFYILNLFLARGTNAYLFMVVMGESEIMKEQKWGIEWLKEAGTLIKKNPIKMDRTLQTKAIWALQWNFQNLWNRFKVNRVHCASPGSPGGCAYSESHSCFSFILWGNSSLPILAYIYVCVFYLAIKIFLCVQSFHTHRSTLCSLHLNYQRQPFILDLFLHGKRQNCNIWRNLDLANWLSVDGC